ncbi:MAG: UDP-N-acetylmuramate--L-alanine ligase [Propionibacteriaceae bacterium]
MPLIEPTAVPDVDALAAVHFIAVGGAGMSGLAGLYADRGHRVSGSDQQSSAALEALAARGLAVHVGHDPAHLAGADTVVVSSAIRDDNVEVVAARDRGLPILHRSTALAALMADRVGIAVGGTHGKTTTSAMIVTALDTRDPGYVVGSRLQGRGASAALGSGPEFVVEADESDGTFLQYPSEIVVVTNVEADHLDNWETPEAYREGFVRFVTAPAVRIVVINIDDPGAAALAESLAGRPVRVVRVGSGEDADIRIGVPRFSGSGSVAEVHSVDGVHALELAVPGQFNLQNAALAHAVARCAGVSAEESVAALATFAGTDRRFQQVGEVAGVRIFDDYAHHPTEVRATLTGARAVSGEGRLIALFQPHLYSRTREFAAEFAAALGLADVVMLTDVYGAREEPVPGITGQLISDRIPNENPNTEVHYVAARTDVAAALADLVRPGDVVLTLGAGDVTRAGPELVALLRRAGDCDD